MNARQLLGFVKTKTGQVIVFGLLLGVGLSLIAGSLYFRGSTPSEKGTTVAKETAPNPKLQKLESWLSGKPAADFANQTNPVSTNSVSIVAADKAPATLPLSLYHSNAPENDLSDTYAPYG